MDTQEYIDSGILESYALGTASDQERREVECLSSIYPEVKTELERIQSSLESYADSIAVKPPKEARQNILEAIKKLEQDEIQTVEQEKEKDNESESPIRVIKMNTYLKIAVAASVAILFGVTYFYNQLDLEYAKLNNRMTSYQEDQKALFNQLKDSLTQNIAEKQFLLDEETQTILLAGTDLSPASKARLFWNKKKQEYVISYDQLPIPAEGKQYQLWAIADGKPVDMGVLNKESDLSQKQSLKIENIQAFAITLEQEGGVEVPTLEAMYVMGTV